MSNFFTPISLSGALLGEEQANEDVNDKLSAFAFASANAFPLSAPTSVAPAAAASMMSAPVEAHALSGAGQQGSITALSLTELRVEVDEANLPLGTHPNPGALIKLIDIPAGYTVEVDSTWGLPVAGIYSKSVPNGILNYDSVNNKLEYTLQNAVRHSLDGRDSLNVSAGNVFLVENASGNKFFIPVTIAVRDDIPQVAAGSDSHALSNASSVVTGWLELKAGADAGTAETSSSISFLLESNHAMAGGTSKSYTLQKNGSPLVIETMSGKMELVYDSSIGKVLYTFTAIGGFQGHSETFTFSIKDGDGDISNATVSMDFVETIAKQGVTVNLYEADIAMLGSNHHGLNESVSVVLPPALVVPNASGFSWTVNGDPAQYRADGNGDGAYSVVRWIEEGDALKGYADGALVIELQPQYTVMGVFTGEVLSTLHKPFLHKGAITEGVQSLDITLTQHGGGISKSLGLKVSIFDDSPFGSAQDATAILDVYRAESVTQSAYVVLDVSPSISKAEGNAAVAAIKALAQSYIDNGIDAVMSLVTFSKTASTVYSNITPQQMLATLDWANIKSKCGTNYEASLDEAMRIMEADLNNPAYANNHHSLYFISDGKVNCGSKGLGDWKSYRDGRGDELDVYSVCVQNKCVSKAMVNHLVDVAGDASGYYHISNYSGMLTASVELGKSIATGNLLGNVASADLTVIDEVVYNNFVYKVGPNGVDINLPSGVKLHVSQNGDYSVKSGKPPYEVLEGLTLRMHDADGDTVSMPAALVFRQPENQAFNNMGVTNEYFETHWLSNFYDIPAPMTNGSYSFGKLPLCGGPVMPMIPGYSEGSYAAKLKPGKNGEQQLNALLGGSAEVKALFQDLNIVQQKFGYNSIVSFKVDAGTADVTFNWAFKPGHSCFYKDAAFWVLKDANGKVVDKGLLHQSGDGRWHTGITNVQIADTSKAYTLHIVQQELGNDYLCPNSTMYLKDVIYNTTVDFRTSGNVIVDPSPDGMVDVLGAANSSLVSIWHNGVEHIINGKTEILCDSGKLVIDNSGDYLFIAKDGMNKHVQEDFTYVLKSGPHEDIKAILHIRSEDRIIRGTNGDDVIDRSTTSEGNDVIIAGAGNDLITGGDAVEFIYGGAGNDTIYAGKGDYAYGGDGDDLIYSEYGFAELHGGNGNDTIYLGGFGIVHGGDGDDIIYGSEASATLYGDAGNDQIYGGGMDDLIYGGAGNDYLDGGYGNDTLYGGTGNDVLIGGAGNDLLYGGSGINRLAGGQGADTFAWDSNSLGGKDTILDFNGAEGDKLSFGDLIQEGFTLDQFFANRVANLGIDAADRTLNFDIISNVLDKKVEIHFQEADNRFDQAASDYHNAATHGEELLALQSLLVAMSS